MSSTLASAALYEAIIALPLMVSGCADCDPALAATCASIGAAAIAGAAACAVDAGVVAAPAGASPVAGADVAPKTLSPGATVGRLGPAVLAPDWFASRLPAVPVGPELVSPAPAGPPGPAQAPRQLTLNVPVPVT